MISLLPPTQKIFRLSTQVIQLLPISPFLLHPRPTHYPVSQTTPLSDNMVAIYNHLVTENILTNESQIREGQVDVEEI